VDLATFGLILAVGLPSAFLFAKALKLHPQKISVTNKIKEALLSIIVFFAVFGGAFGIYAFYDRIWIRATLTADPLYVLRGAIAATVILLPMIVALKYSRLNHRNIGMTKLNLKKSLIFSLAISLVLILVIGGFSPFLGGRFIGFSSSMGYLLLSYIIAGFSEEIIFRGCIQTRLTARIGSVVGIFVSALLYAAYNFPLGFFCFSGNIQLAAVYAALRFSPGVIYGYVFEKTQNVVSSSIVHTLLIWGGLLFGLYL